MLADAISIDGRKEWICKFSSESNCDDEVALETCCTIIPAELRGKYQQAVKQGPENGQRALRR